MGGKWYATIKTRFTIDSSLRLPGCRVDRPDNPDIHRDGGSSETRRARPTLPAELRGLKIQVGSRRARKRRIEKRRLNRRLRLRATLHFARGHRAACRAGPQLRPRLRRDDRAYSKSRRDNFV